MLSWLWNMVKIIVVSFVGLWLLAKVRDDYPVQFAQVVQSLDQIVTGLLADAQGESKPKQQSAQQRAGDTGGGVVPASITKSWDCPEDSDNAAATIELNTSPRSFRMTTMTKVSRRPCILEIVNGTTGPMWRGDPFGVGLCGGVNASKVVQQTINTQGHLWGLYGALPGKQPDPEEGVFIFDRDKGELRNSVRFTRDCHPR
jgi:hypothetical protein